MINLDKKSKIHFIGIGGIGMSAIADILIAQGHSVSGSDMNKNDMIDKLKKDGAKIFVGHDGNNVEDSDLIVYTAAIGNENPELLRARELGIEIVTRAEMLGILMAQSNNSIAVAGTHGKTTTTSMLSLILKNADLDPTLLVGGNLEELNGNVRVGGREYFVTEACEYMDSFLSLKPKIEIILNIDSDHLDYFRDIDHIVESFEKFTHLVPEEGFVFAYSANPFVSRAVKGMDNVVTFGLNEDCNYAALNIEFNHEGMPSYELHKDGKKLTDIQLGIPGEYNILNSLAAISCAHVLGVNIEIAKNTLKNFKGTQRRFDIMGVTKKGVKIVDDYAHHPTEIKEALKAANKIPHRKLWCLFQPHTYTRTLALFNEFAQAFDDADNIIMVEIYAAREKNIYKLSSKSVAEEIKKNSPTKNVEFLPTFEEIVKHVMDNSNDGDLVLTMGAGDVYKIGEMILEKDAKE